MVPTDDTCSTILAMRSQEEAYRRCQCLDDIAPSKKLFLPSLTNNSNVDQSCRYLMIKWWFQIIDYCKMSRDTVAVAASYLDRFLMTDAGEESRQNAKVFQLAAMTCLYTAIKTQETEAMTPKVVASLGGKQGFTGAAVEEMERKIITALEWRMNPPTCLAFVHLYLDFLPDTIDKNERKTLLEVAKYQTELATEEYSMVSINASTIAFAAFANSLESMNADFQYEILDDISKVSGVDRDSEEYINAQNGLWVALDRSVGNGDDFLLPLSNTAVTSKSVKPITRRGNTSPRTVLSKQC